MLSELPVARYGQALTELILRKGTRLCDKVTIVRSEAGSGKSTVLPSLMADRNQRILMAEPTRLGVYSLARWVAEIRNSALGDEVGYRHAGEMKFGKKTKILYAPSATVFNMLAAGKADIADVLCIDEAHLYTRDIELNLALAKQRLKNSSNLRLIVTSATLETGELSNFFDHAEVFSIEGRNYQVQELDPVGDLVECALWGIRRGINVLFFERGAEQIYEWLQKIEIALKKEGLEASTHALYANANPHEQQRCFERTNTLKIIGATNYAETSVTLPNIGLVIDTGMHNQLEVHDGVEGLYSRVISKSSRLQRKFRTGRELNGYYMDLCKTAQRDEYQIPEIQRAFFSGHLLRLIASRRKIDNLELLHPLPVERKQEAYDELRLLKFLDSKDRITENGKRAAFLGVEPSSAAMLIEADMRGVLEDLIPVVALRESGGLSIRGAKLQDPDSDWLAESSLFMRMYASGGQNCTSMGINQVSYNRAAETYRELYARLAGDCSFRITSSSKRFDFIRSILAGELNKMFRVQSGAARKIGAKRICTLQTGVRLSEGEIVVGEPRDLQRPGQERFSVDRVLRSVTRIGVEAIVDIAPELITSSSYAKAEYDPQSDTVCSKMEVFILGEKLESHLVGAVEGASRVLAMWLAEFLLGSHHAASLFQKKKADIKPVQTGGSLADYQKRKAASALQAEAELVQQEQRESFVEKLEKLRCSYAKSKELITKLNQRAGIDIAPDFKLSAIVDRIEIALCGICKISEITNWKDLDYKLDPALSSKVERDNPNTINLPSGRTVKVEYNRGPKPQVSVSDWWKELPDHPVILPSGRAVDFVIFGSISSSDDLVGLKAEAQRRGY